MNQHDLDALQKHKSYPSVTLLMPTPHTSAIDLQENHIRFKNLLKTAQERLTGDVSKHDATAILDKITALESDIPFESPDSGVAIFVNKDTANVFTLPFEPHEEVVVDETFHTRHLVHALNRTKHYYVLTLTRDVVRLYKATRDKLTEVKEGGFPMTPDPAGVQTEGAGTYGVDTGQYDKQQERVMLQHADNALDKIVGSSTNTALVIVGDAKATGYFQTDSKHKENIIGSVSGNYEKVSTADLAEKAWPVAREGFAARRAQVLQNFEDGANNLRAEGLAEAWFVAHEGRVGTLLIEEDYHQAGRVSEDGMNLELVDDPTASGVMDDAADELVECVLKMGGRVTFLDNGMLEKHGRVAAILRF